IHNEKLVQTLLKGYSILSLECSLSGDCDVEKNGMLDKFDRGLQTDVQVFVDFDYAMAAYMTLTGAWKKKIWLKGLLVESGYELSLVAGIATGALVKGGSWSEVPAQMTLVDQSTMNQNEEIYLATSKFESNDDLLKSVRAFYYAKGYGLSIRDSKKDQYVTLQCDLSGVYQDKRRAGTKRKKSTTSRLTDCPFQITGFVFLEKEDKDHYVWVLSVFKKILGDGNRPSVLHYRVCVQRSAVLNAQFYLSSSVYYGICFGWGGRGGGGDGSFGGVQGFSGLFPEFYSFSCPQANDIVISVLEDVIAKDPRMAASLLRLHFHDCFVQGCDASVLLDDSAMFTSEKNAGPNANSIRGFEVIDEIKSKLEEACPETVSCADILALAARGSTVLSGGPNWELPLGRRDATQANFKESNNNLPPPNSTIQNLITLFRRQGLDEVDLVSLSGAHTIGMARCTSFKQRLYNQDGNNQPDSTLERTYSNGLKEICPKTGGDGNISPLDFSSPARFDNTYFKLIMWGKGLLTSDQVLLNGNVEETMFLVKAFAEDDSLFYDQFARSMVKMGNINPLTGFNGEIRKNCRMVNQL
ncbi:peroxidase 9, partial [Tanacetum coccineum]